MQQLNKWQSAIFLTGGFLMVIGAALCIFLWEGAPYVFALGAIAFASMQMLQRYEGSNVTIRRLRRIMLLSDILFLVSAFLMFASKGNVFGISQITYVQYIYNKWVGTLILAAILQVYSVHRIDNELSKEAKKR
ncbi:MAG: hypothetical protein K6F22_02500 [Prevotella sp.]|nr:hypothetical protein [Prevotella sp.]